MGRKISILFHKDVIEFLDELLYTLYNKNYFSYKSSAPAYVLKIYDYIETNIVALPHKKTPDNLKYLGVYYIFYKPNKRTTWFIFFEKKDAVFKITSIINNYCKEANGL